MNVIKRQSIANWISLGTLVFALIGFILYAVNIGSAGYFNGITVSSLVTWGVIAMVLVVVTIAMAQFSFDGIVGKVYGIVLDALRILIPLLMFIAMFAFISSGLKVLHTFTSLTPTSLKPFRRPKILLLQLRQSPGLYSSVFRHL
ncbi:MAG: hypothetical protein ACLSU0_07455 [Oscillospiraceae bacterium]